MQVQKTINQLHSDKSIVAITHQLATVQDFDQIFVLQNGQLIESGTHQALLAHHGLYANLYRLQNALPERTAPMPSRPRSVALIRPSIG